MTRVRLQLKRPSPHNKMSADFPPSLCNKGEIFLFLMYKNKADRNIKIYIETYSSVLKSVSSQKEALMLGNKKKTIEVNDTMIA